MIVVCLISPSESPLLKLLKAVTFISIDAPEPLFVVVMVVFVHLTERQSKNLYASVDDRKLRGGKDFQKIYYICKIEASMM